MSASIVYACQNGELVSTYFSPSDDYDDAISNTCEAIGIPIGEYNEDTGIMTCENGWTLEFYYMDEFTKI